jgi:hypothetical protein
MENKFISFCDEPDPTDEILSNCINFIDAFEDYLNDLYFEGFAQILLNTNPAAFAAEYTQFVNNYFNH